MNSKFLPLLPLSLLTTMAVSISLQFPLIAQSPLPVPSVTRVPVSQSVATLNLVNQTAHSITYEALGDTQPRILTAGDEITLQNLNTPATLTFFYENIPKDRQTGEGLLQAALSLENTNGILTIVIRPTTDLDADVSNITIESNGNVSVF
ncbi:hypothetical protein [Leptothoe sp. PORK10 BA2]|uniref:hypothetical protein n=1 Tax=Leptothoe sp. PORK10 BA2 TaxID=3110254 RepID=UPI002B2179A8|nr:hypothetical protein [Leptothoe sp. PORK10 BA2]MEA5466253.1 hypothetical protein [Leptothoe sp. PORK10 BA2]